MALRLGNGFPVLGERSADRAPPAAAFKELGAVIAPMGVAFFTGQNHCVVGRSGCADGRSLFFLGKIIA